jgi:hypothetical protein
MTCKRSLFSTTLALSVCGLVALPIAFACEYYPDWAGPVLLVFFLAVFVVGVSLGVFVRRRRREGLVEFAARLRDRTGVICSASAGVCLASLVGGLDGDLFKAISLTMAVCGTILVVWNVFRAWPDRSAV